MDDQTDLGKFTVHGQFVLDLNLCERLSSDDAASLGRLVADSLSPTLAKLFEETAQFTGTREIQVLCSGGIWRPDGEAALSRHSVQLSPMSQSGWHEIEALRVGWGVYDC